MYIRQATILGYIKLKLVRNCGVFDTAYPTSKLRRGRVQGEGQLCPTLTACEPTVVKIELI